MLLSFLWNFFSIIPNAYLSASGGPCPDTNHKICPQWNASTYGVYFALFLGKKEKCHTTFFGTGIKYCSRFHQCLYMPCRSPHEVSTSLHSQTAFLLTPPLSSSMEAPCPPSFTLCDLAHLLGVRGVLKPSLFLTNVAGAAGANKTTAISSPHSFVSSLERALIKMDSRRLLLIFLQLVHFCRHILSCRPCRTVEN